MSTTAKAGRYEIVGEVGRGAMGVVYKAIDPVIGRSVAVKTIRLSEAGTGLSRPELLTRFQTEARAAGLLTHPNIVVVYDAGEEDGLYYITMELVEGRSVQALLDEGQRFSLPRVLRIMEQTCGALQFAHERHVVHRDIKPANLMLTADDTVKVTDFGTAKILQFGTVQQTTHVMGTPSYMSPEQVKGRAVDGRSDIFSLGVMLYEMVTGEKPFPGQSITTVIYKIVNEDPVPPRQLDPAIHAGISAVIMKALVKEPENRYQSCREMLEDLRNYRTIAGQADGLAGNPQSTMALGAVSPAATIAGGARNHAHDDQMAPPAGWPVARAAIPAPAAANRAGRITPLKEVKKKSVWSSLLIAILLLGMIAWGAYKLKPVLLDARNIQERDVSSHENGTRATPGEEPSVNSGTASNEVANVPPAPPSVAPAPAGKLETQAEAKPAGAGPEKSVAKSAAPVKTDNGLTPQAAQYKKSIEATIAERGLTGRAKVQGAANALTLAGKLRPAEHGALLKFLRDAPADVRIIDHIEYDDTPLSPSAAPDEASHPVPPPDRGAIHIVTDVLGATATLLGSNGKQLRQCQTPCSFNGLQANRFSLEVKKDGYRTVQTALQVKAGEVIDEKLKLESLAAGLRVVSDPPGADVFINGAKQSGQTPVLLPLAAGQYNLVLRLAGYSAYSGVAQVKDNVQTEVSAQLHAKDTSKVAWAEVSSIPPGAEIVVDGTTTSQSTPSRVQLPPGMHTITLKMKGFQPARRTVQVSEGGTVRVEETLKVPK